MRLQRLTGLEREKIQQEYNEVMALIARLKEIDSSQFNNPHSPWAKLCHKTICSIKQNKYNVC